MSDEEIVGLFLAKDETAITKTQDKYRRYLHKIAVQILGSEEDAEECVNDVYLVAWNTIADNRPEKLSTYLGKITRRRAIDMLRKRSADKRIPSEFYSSVDELAEVLPGGSNPEEELAGEQLEHLIAEFVHGLPAEQKRLFVGRYYYFHSLKEVASYCGMRESKAKSMLFRIRCRLKEYLEKEGYTV